MTEPARPYTPRDLAARWKCSEQHVRDLINAGQLTAFRLGRLIRVRQDEVERFERGEEICGSSGIAAPGASTGATGETSHVESLSARRIGAKLSAASGTGSASSSRQGR